MSNYFIVVSCSPDGVPRLPQRKQGKDYFLHNDIDAAYTEAARLSKQHKGVKFGVCELHVVVGYDKDPIVDIEVKIKVA